MSYISKFYFNVQYFQLLKHAPAVSSSSLSCSASTNFSSSSALQCGTWLSTAGGTLPGGYWSPWGGIWCACTNSDQAHASPFFLRSPQHQGTCQETAQEVFLVALSLAKDTTGHQNTDVDYISGEMKCSAVEESICLMKPVCSLLTFENSEVFIFPKTSL